MQERKIEVIGYDCGWGCRNFNCEDGPAALAMDRILHGLTQRGQRARWQVMGLKSLGDHKTYDTKEKTLPLLVEGLKRLSNTAHMAASHGNLPLVIGGDHSSAMGTWPGIVSALGAEEKFGLIWIDAHMDAHTPETAHEGKWGGWWHGMPVAALTGAGLPALTGIAGTRRKLSPEHVSLIGVRSFEPGEEGYLTRNGLRVYMMDEVRKRGFAAVYQEALIRATTGTAGFGLSIDLDAFDPDDAPGVGTREAGGLNAEQFLSVIREAGLHPDLKGVEIAEYNPHNDQGDKTKRLIERIIFSMFDKTPV